MYINIKGYSNYRVNKFGEVEHFINGKWRKVKPATISNGKYKTITLWRGGKRKVFMLHNVVAETFNISVEDAKHACYNGYSLIPGAKENVRNFILQAIADREQSGKLEESKYLRECLNILK